MIWDMKFTILEDNRDRKGTILEKVVAAILERRGYDVTRNEISAGGNEIDVLAQRHNSHLGVNETIICECKAHENPIGMNDWLKFLGKYYKEQRKNPHSYGLMVALSDANGNVKGDIRESEYGDRVSLLTGIDVYNYTKDFFGICSKEELNHVLNTWSKCSIVDLDIAYFQDNIYWIVYISDGTFTVLDKNASFPDSSVLSEILGCFAGSSVYSKEQYVDIRMDKVLELKRRSINTVALWHLMSGEKTFQTIAEEVSLSTGNSIKPEIYEIMHCLKEFEFVEISNDSARLKQIDSTNKVDFYRYLLTLGIPTRLYNKFYVDNIDESLLDEILAIQGGLRLTSEERKISMFILRHSPSALRRALNPDPLFHPRSNMVDVDVTALDESKKSTFIQTLANCLEVDCDSDIAMFLFDKLKIRDFQKQVHYSVVTEDGEIATIPVVKRLFYIPFEDQEGGAVVQASRDFIGQYNPESGLMVAGKRKNLKEKQLFGVVKHKTGESEDEYLSLYL